jgi:hypothetical protein
MPLSLKKFIEQIRESFPWYFEMKDLVSERPNIIPVGIGNSRSGVDMQGFLGKSDDGVSQGDGASQGEETPISWPASEDEDEVEGDREPAGTELKDEDNDMPVPTKHKLPPPTKRTAACVGTSTPAVKHESKKARSMIEKFSDVAKSQEETIQKNLDMKMKRLEANRDANVARIKALENIQIEKDKHKAELEMEKLKMEHERMRWEHELRMSQLGQPRGSSASTSFRPYGSSLPSATSSSVDLDSDFDDGLFLPQTMGLPG